LRQKENVLKNQWDQFKDKINEYGNFSGDRKKLDTFLESLSSHIQQLGSDYIRVIKSLDDTDSNIGTLWLKGIVDYIVNDSTKILMTS